MNSEEWHSFLIGLLEVLCPWPARYRVTGASQFKPFREHHHYLAGRAIAFPILTLELLAFAYLATHLLS